MSAGPQVANTPPKSPFYAFVSPGTDVATLQAFAQSRQLPAANVLEGDIGTAAEFLKNHASPEVLLVEISSSAEAPAQLEALSEVCDPDTKVIIVGSVNEFSFYCWLMEIGISSYLLKPLTQVALETAWTKAIEPPAPAGAQSARTPGRVIGITGSRGGAGATSISIYLAAMLAQGSGKKIALIDLDPQDGSVSLLLDIEPSRGMREALEKPDRIDTLFLDRVMNKTEHGFYILSAEEGLSERVNFHDQAADVLIKELRGQYDLIILDLPRQNTVFARACMKICEPLLVVTELTIAGLRDSLRISDLMRDHLRIKPPIFIANKLGLAPKQEMPVSEFANGLNAKVEFQLPFAPEVFMNISGELEALKLKNNAALKLLHKIAERLLEENTAAAGGKESGSLFGMLKKGK